MAGLAFKASVAPFHQWTPDVYEGAPTPVTGFMAVATKAAAFGIMLRLFDGALIDAVDDLGAGVRDAGRDHDRRRQRRRDRAVVAEAPAGLLVGGPGGLHAGRRRGVRHRLGVQATVFYLAIYVIMNLAAFAVITARERETGLGDDISSLYGLGADRPWLAWPMTIAMLALAGFPATAGFFGKIYLIDAAVEQRLRLARRRDRARLGGLAGLLPARDRRGLDALAVRGAGGRRCRCRGPPGDRRRLGRGRRGGPRGRPRAGRR